VRLIDAVSFIETAKPPASSAGPMMRFPLESLERLFCKLLLFEFRLRDAAVAAMLVFIVNAISYILLDYVLFILTASCRPGPIGIRDWRPFVMRLL